MPILEHGLATFYSHFDVPKSRTRRKLRVLRFVPFKASKDLPVSSLASFGYRKLDQATLVFLKTLINLICAGIGFDGLIISDDISQKHLAAILECSVVHQSKHFVI